MSYDDDDILDTTQLHLQGEFDQQVDQLLARVRLSRSEVEALADLYQDIEDAVNKCYNGCQVYPFGSIVTGLGIKTSDVDVFVQVPQSWNNNKMYKLQPVYRLRDHLKGWPQLFAAVQAVPAAKVPIVKCYHLPRHRYCDINFKSYAGLRNSKLIAFLLQMDYRALPLAVIIKYWSKVHSLTGTNRMPNYALTMMVIFYLQQVGILPPVCELQNDVEEFVVDNWNTAFRDDFQFESKNRESLYVLLGGFFDFYKNFKFHEFIISPFLGKPVHRSKFLEPDSLPEEYERYKSLVKHKVCEPIKVKTNICVQDPFEHARNCGAAIYEKLAVKIIHFISECFDKFEVVKKENFLQAILMNIPYQDVPPNKKKNKNNRNVNNSNKNTTASVGKVVKAYRKPWAWNRWLQKSPYSNAIHTLYLKYQHKGT